MSNDYLRIVHAERQQRFQREAAVARLIRIRRATRRPAK